MLNIEAAQSLALQVLAWLAQDPEQIGGFLGVSGLNIDELKQRAGEPELLASVMDYLLSEDGRVLAFCHAHGIKPDLPLAARAALPGGDVPHWT